MCSYFGLLKVFIFRFRYLRNFQESTILNSFVHAYPDKRRLFRTQENNPDITKLNKIQKCHSMFWYRCWYYSLPKELPIEELPGGGCARGCARVIYYYLLKVNSFVSEYHWAPMDGTVRATCRPPAASCTSGIQRLLGMYQLINRLINGRYQICSLKYGITINFL